MQPVQLYEASVYDRQSRAGVRIVVAPARFLIDAERPSPDQLVDALGFDPSLVAEVEPWGLPFLIDASIGRLPDFPWVLEIPFPGARRRGERPSPFAQYVTYTPIVPVEESPLEGRTLAELTTAGWSIGGAVGFYATGNPLVLLAVPAGIIVCGAAEGVAEALRIGLRTRLLRLMGVEQEDEQT